MVFINILNFKVTLDLFLDFKLSVEVHLMIECFKICNYYRESYALLILNCATIFKTAVFLIKMSFFTIFNKADDLVKNKVDL